MNYTQIPSYVKKKNWPEGQSFPLLEDYFYEELLFLRKVALLMRIHYQK